MQAKGGEAGGGGGEEEKEEEEEEEEEGLGKQDEETKSRDFFLPVLIL